MLTYLAITADYSTPQPVRWLSPEIPDSQAISSSSSQESTNLLCTNRDLRLIIKTALFFSYIYQEISKAFGVTLRQVNYTARVLLTL